MRIGMKPGTVIKTMKMDGKNVIFRTIRESDIDDLFEHINMLVKERAFISMQHSATPKEEKKWLKRSIESLKKNKTITVVVETDGKAIASAHVAEGDKDAIRHVCEIGVGLMKEYRGIGIGTELMKVLLDIGKKILKCSMARLSVYEPNKAAKHVYEKIGFKEAGRIPKGCNYYGKYYDEIIMVKEL